MTKLFPVKTGDQIRALQARDRFLCEHPDLKRLQADIDKKLSKAATANNRLVIIHDLMMDSLREMNDRLQLLLGRRGR